MFPFPVAPHGDTVRRSIVDAASFDGANDYATRGAGLTGAADSKKFTLVFWTNGPSGGDYILCSSGSVGGGVGRFFSQKRGANSHLQIVVQDTAGADALDIESNTTMAPAGSWRCRMISVDMADTAKRHMYFADSDVLSVTKYVNTTLDFTDADWAIGAAANGSNKYSGGLAEFFFWPGVYVDFSVEANRRMFITASGKPVDPTVALAALGAPAIYFHLDDGETANNFVANNDGGATGGAFTVTGALSTYASSPSD